MAEPTPVPVSLADAVELAARLAEITANLSAYIERRANEIAAPVIAAEREQAAERIREVRVAFANAKQRADDLEAELHRQLDHQIRRADRAEARVKQLTASLPDTKENDYDHLRH